MPIPEINWAGIPLATKFEQMQSGPGVGGVQPVEDALRKLGEGYAASADNINRALPDGMSWKGSAATAATHSLGRTAQSTQHIGEAGQRGGSLVADYARVFADSKSRIAKPVEQSWFSKVTDWVGLTDDHATIVAQNRALDDAANRAMKAYEVQARTSLASFPDPTAPPPAGAPATGAKRPASPAPARGGAPAPGAAPGGGPGSATPGGSPQSAPQDAPNRLSPRTPPAALPPGPGPGTPQTAPRGSEWTPLADRPSTSPPPGSSVAPFPSPSPGVGLSSRPDSSTSPRRGAVQSPLPQRPGGVDRRAGPGLEWTGSPAGTPASKAPGPAGAMPPPITGRGGKDSDGHFHCNGVYIPSDEPFVVGFDDDVLPGHVLGSEDAQ